MEKTPQRPFLVFLIIVLSIYTGLHAYVWWRLMTPLGLSGMVCLVWALGYGVLIAGFPVVHFGLRQRNGPVVLALNFLFSVWAGMIIYFFLATLAVDVVWVIPFGRRTTEVITAVVLAVTIYGVIAARSIVVTRMNVRMKRLPAALEGFRIAQISDIHMGWIVRGARLEKIVRMVNDLEPDLIVITGDLVDEQALHMEDMVEPLRHLKSRHGVYAVTGNHEYFAGVERAAAFIEKAGVTLLRNRWVEVAGGLQLIGRDDVVAERMTGEKTPSLNEIMRGIDPAKPVIFLYHTPTTTLEELQARGIDLQLSGHTHRGQLWPFNFIVRRTFETYYGRFTKGDTTVYVSRGTGTWGPPLRVLARPEIAFFTLTGCKVSGGE